VKPVPEEYVTAILPHVRPQVAAMIQLQLVTGMRSGEVSIMRGCDLNTVGKIWEYRPASHKTQHHGHDKVILLGPRAQNIVKPWLKPDLQAYLFSPRESRDAFDADRR
jgi:integrase